MLIYPEDIEQRLEVADIRSFIKSKCSSDTAKDTVDNIRPLANFDELSLILSQTAECIQILKDGINKPLAAFEDIRGLLIKIRTNGSYLFPEDFMVLSRGLRAIHQWSRFLNENSEDYPALSKKITGFNVEHSLAARIEKTIDEKGEVKDNASPELAKIRSEIIRSEKNVRKSVKHILSEAKKDKYVDAESEVTIREGRLVIPVRAEHKRKISGFVHDESSTGQTVFMEPAEVLALNNEVKEWRYQEKREIQRILIALSDTIRAALPEIEHGAIFLIELDVIYAKSLFALEFDAIIPKIVKTSGVQLSNAVHPLLFKHNQLHKKSVVSFSVNLVHDGDRILVISGPNAGGKSVTMKTVGLLQYMLQCGFPVTAGEESVFGIFSNIFLDIGDAQSLENDLSTYSSRLAAMKYFSQFADNRSLILIDEFGTGTEPQFGGAIAEALLDRMSKLKAYGVITTHYSNVKQYAGNTEGLVNGAMSYDSEKLEPLYQLKIGNPGSSFAFEIAKKIGLHPSLIEYAKGKVGISQVDYDKMLNELQSDKIKYEKLITDLKSKENELTELRNDYRELKDILQTEKKRIIKEAKNEARGIVENANRTIEGVIRNIKESKAEKEKTKESRRKVEALKNALSDDKSKMNSPGIHKNKINVGDHVRIVGQENIGEVLTVKSTQAQVSFGSLKSFVSTERLEKISKTQVKKQAKQMLKGINLNDKLASFTGVLDVRGKRAEEVISIVDGFLDDAILGGFREVKILHGKGHGILRDLIRSYLSKDSNVANISDEHIERGGSGISVITLKI